MVNNNSPEQNINEEMLSILKGLDEFLTFDKGGVCIRVAYKARQDEMLARVHRAIAAAENK